MALKDPIPAMKRALAKEIVGLVGDWNYLVAARALGLDPPRLCDLRYGKLERFSIAKLIRILAHVDRRVDMTVVNLGAPRLPMFRFPPGTSRFDRATGVPRGRARGGYED